MCMSRRRISNDAGMMPLRTDRVPVGESSGDNEINNSVTSPVGNPTEQSSTSTMTHHSAADKMRTSPSSRQIDNRRSSGSHLILSSPCTTRNELNETRRVSKSINKRIDSFPFVLASPNLASSPVLRTIPRGRVARLSMNQSFATNTYETIKNSLYSIEMKFQLVE